MGPALLAIGAACVGRRRAGLLSCWRLGRAQGHVVASGTVGPTTVHSTVQAEQQELQSNGPDGGSGAPAATTRATARGPRRLRVEGAAPCGGCLDADKTTWWELTRRTAGAPRSTATT